MLCNVVRCARRLCGSYGKAQNRRRSDSVQRARSFGFCWVARRSHTHTQSDSIHKYIGHVHVFFSSSLSSTCVCVSICNDACLHAARARLWFAAFEHRPRTACATRPSSDQYTWRFAAPPEIPNRTTRTLARCTTRTIRNRSLDKTVRSLKPLITCCTRPRFVSGHIEGVYTKWIEKFWE